MVHDLSQDVKPSANGQYTPREAIAGLMPPQLGEANIREAGPTPRGVALGVASLGAKLIQGVFLAPLGWLLNGLLFGRRFMPFLCKRYSLTNRRLWRQHGWERAPGQEMPLKDIEGVGYDAFLLSGDLDLLSAGNVVMKLIRKPEPDSFRHAILNSEKAWGVM